MSQATGLEKAELESELEGKDLFADELSVDVFGTAEKPAIIKTTQPEKIIGCYGNCADGASWWGGGGAGSGKGSGWGRCGGWRWDLR